MPKTKIICVDDEQNILDSLQRSLRSDYHISCHLNPEEALKELNKSPDFDLIICDFKMPQKLGSEILKVVSLQFPHMGRILLSAEVDNDYLMEGINKNHFHKLVLKPWDPNYLKIQIKEALLYNQTHNDKIKYEKLSKIDPVTGLWNHRHFQSHLAKIFYEQLDHCALLMADIDFFKSFNDRYGHLEGDLVLKEVSRRLIASAPKNSLVFRYGGEEFAILAFGIKEENLLDVSETIRKSVADTPIESLSQKSLYVTLSLGAHLIDLDKSKNDAIDAADKALFKAKDKGRNRVEVLKLAT